MKQTTSSTKYSGGQIDGEGPTVVTRESKNGTALMLEVRGEFDFHLHQCFPEAYQQGGKRFKRYIVNLKACPHIDSCGLGLLLQLKEYTQSFTEDLRITGCADAVLKVLRISKFDRVFQVEG